MCFSWVGSRACFHVVRMTVSRTSFSDVATVVSSELLSEIPRRVSSFVSIQVLYVQRRGEVGSSAHQVCVSRGRVLAHLVGDRKTRSS